MSKKTQKKTLKKASKAATGKAPKKTPEKSSKKSAKKSSAKPAAKKKSAKAAKPAASAAKASHPATSKTLKAQRPKAAAKPEANPKGNLATAAEIVAQPVARPVTAPKSESVAAAPVAATASHGPLAEGTKAPAFHLPRDGGATVSLSDYAGQKLVLFFYPRADTPGCTREAIDFTRLADAFAESGTVVLGVSADSPKAQEAFRNKHQLAVPLASDERHAMLEAYGVWGEKSMYGRTFLGITRTTVLIGGDGRVIRIWRNVKVDGHADEVLAAAQSA